MNSITASVRIAISGGRDAWKIAEPNDPQVLERDVRLEIQGDDRGGYHLVLTPEGCFTADTWHETLAEAIEEAANRFGVLKSAWSPVGTL